MWNYIIIIMVLTVLQWNARSIIANGPEFKKYIDQLDQKLNILNINHN